MGRSIEILDCNSQESLYPFGAARFYAGRMDTKELGAWVKAARQSRGWTQQHLGDLIGRGKQNVSGWEKGRHEPSFLQVLRIRDLTGYPLDAVAQPFGWPFPMIRQERITSLPPEQLAMAQAALIGVLASFDAGRADRKRNGTDG
jgi:transcriptional regulator with XRE-family HTH domain